MFQNVGCNCRQSPWFWSGICGSISKISEIFSRISFIARERNAYRKIDNRATRFTQCAERHACLLAFFSACGSCLIPDKRKRLGKLAAGGFIDPNIDPFSSLLPVHVSQRCLSPPFSWSHNLQMATGKAFIAYPLKGREVQGGNLGYGCQG